MSHIWLHTSYRKQFLLQQEQHGQGSSTSCQLLGWGLHWRLPGLRVTPDAQQGFTGDLSDAAAESLSAVNRYTGKQLGHGHRVTVSCPSVYS